MLDRKSKKLIGALLTNITILSSGICVCREVRAECAVRGAAHPALSVPGGGQGQLLPGHRPRPVPGGRTQGGQSARGEPVLCGHLQGSATRFVPFVHC